MFDYEHTSEICDELTRVFRYDDHISYVTEYLGDYASDYDVQAIAGEAFSYDPHAGGFRLVLDGADFDDCVQRHEISE